MSTVMSAVDDVQHEYRPRNAAGRLTDPAATSNDRNYGLAMHLVLLGCAVSGAIGSFVLPVALVVMWLVKREDSRFIDDHGREACNVMITGLLCVALCFVIIGFPLLLAWIVVTFINSIRAAGAASRGEFFRYPITVRLLS